MTSRDSNRGGCCQSCRWDYQLMKKDNDQIIPVSLSEEETSFNMSAKDMDTLNYLPQILELGVDSLKVEGRMKTYHYVATVTKVYRQAIDSYYQDPDNFKVKDEWVKELEKAASRETYIGAFIGDLGIEDQIYNEQYKPASNIDFVGMVVNYHDGYIKVEQRNCFCKGDNIEILTPNGDNITFSIDKMYNKDGELIDRANHPLMEVYIPYEVAIPNYSMIRKIK